MFSVVIPLYNKEISIKSTIQSVLNQTYQEFEIVVIDDGSTDNSAERVKAIRDSRVRLIQQNNQGVSAARNRGIDEAKYKWIALLDGDDLWLDNHLSEIRNTIGLYPDNKVFSTSFSYSDNRFLVPIEKQKAYKVTSYFKDALNYTLLSSSTIVVQKECFSIAGYFDTKLTHGEDIEMWSRLAKNYNIIKIPTITAVYRVDAENRTTLCQDLSSLHVYHFDLENYDSIEERDYYRKLILNYMLQYFLRYNFSNFVRLKNKHKQISFVDFLKYSFNHLNPLIFNKIMKTLNKNYKISEL